MEILKGTEIRMSDGSTKPIEELVVGDKVMTNRQGGKGIYTGNINTILDEYLVYFTNMQ